MSTTTIGLLSPGEMGQAVGGVLRASGLEVLTCLHDRSERSRALATQAGFTDVPSLRDLVQRADIVLSILVPAAALDVAREVAAAIRDTRADLLYVDCNAISPATMRAIGETILATGGRVADVGIVGPPPSRPGTKFYVSGPGASEFAQLTSDGLDIRLLDGGIGQASGFKMCYGALTKGLQALTTELLVAARLLGLEDPLRAEQQETMGPVLAWAEGALPSMPPKAHRWVGEMEEIAKCFAELGLTPSILQGAADIYRFVADTPVGQETPETRDRNRDARAVIKALSDSLAGTPS